MTPGTAFRVGFFAGLGAWLAFATCSLIVAIILTVIGVASIFGAANSIDDTNKAPTAAPTGPPTIKIPSRR